MFVVASVAPVPVPGPMLVPALSGECGDVRVLCGERSAPGAPAWSTCRVRLSLWAGHRLARCWWPGSQPVDVQRGP